MKKKKIIAGLFAAIIVTAAMPVYSFAAEGDVEINETNFPDANVLYAVKKCDKNKDSVLSKEEIEAVTSMSFSSYPAPLGDLTGLEYFTNLESISISSSTLTELDFSNFPKLTTLKCYGIDLTSLNVSKNTELTTLDCSSNKLTSLDLSNNTKLETVKVNGNSLTSLTVGNNTSLVNLNCYNNSLTELDLSGCTALQILDCSSNKFASLDFSKNTELTELSVKSNYSLTSLDVTKCTKLTDLDTRYTEALTELDLTNNSALEIVNSSYGGLVHLYLGDSYPNLKNLGIDTNALVEVDLSGITNTGYVNVRDNALTSLDISNCLDSANVVATGNAYDIEVDDTRTFDLSTLPGKFDITKASGWTGGTVSENILTVNADTETVTYNYDIGKNKSIAFTLNVKEKTYALGDVNMDGNITIDDATLIQNYLVDKSIAGTFNLELADVNKDGTVNISDATYIQLIVANRI